LIDRVAALRRAASWLDGEVEDLSATALRRVQEREPSIVLVLVGQRSQALADIEEGVRALAEAMRRDIAAVDHGTGGAVGFAVAAATAGVSWESFATAWSGYRAVIADAIIEHLAGPEWEGTAGAEEQRAVMRFLLDYEDAAGAAMAAAFQQARGRGEPLGRADLGAQIDDLLAGQEVRGDPPPFDADGGHLAAIAWGPAGRAAAEDIGHFLGLPVTIEQRRETVWAWVHGEPDTVVDALVRAREFVPPAGAQLALGEPEEGSDGFATSHFQACGAERVGMLSGAPLTLFADVGLEAFALDDERLARAFVERVLGPLAEDDPRAATLRDTLAAYFSAGNSASAAAAALDLHERTVSYRIRAAEQRLGRYIIDCQDDLALALRLRELFTTAPEPTLSGDQRFSTPGPP
jgi:PucR C-terminal helix-turn-helix domain